MDVLDCPFCGGVPRHETSSDGCHVRCADLSCFIKSPAFTTCAEALAWWNRRATVPNKFESVLKFIETCESGVNHPILSKEGIALFAWLKRINTPSAD